jgi:hypothetical protein
MKIKLLLASLFVLFISPMAQANASCGAGYGNAVDVNVTTKVVTYYCIKLPDPQPDPIRVEPVAPTHTLVVQTPTQGVGMSGTPEQIAASVATLIERAVSVPTNPCADGGCTKMEVNATTQEVTVTPLTLAEVRKQTDENAQSAIKNAEMVKKVSQALPNIQPIDPLAETVEPTPLSEEEPDWWMDFLRALAEFYFWYNDVNWWATL